MASARKEASGRRWETIGPNLHEAKQVLAQRMWERRNAKFRLDRQPRLDAISCRTFGTS